MKSAQQKAKEQPSLEPELALVALKRREPPFE